MAETREYQFTNLGNTKLVNGISAVATSFSVVNGSILPALSVGQIATLVLRDDEAGKYEIMNMTARSGNTLTVERGAEGTTPAIWSASTIVRNALTAGFFEKLASLPATRFRTSKPYPYVFIEALDNSGIAVKGSPTIDMVGADSDGNSAEALDVTGEPMSGTLRTQLQSYLNWPVEALDVGGSPQSGVLDPALITYTNWPVEAVDLAGLPVSGTLANKLITYSNYAVEAVDITGRPVSGTLT